MNRKKNIFRLGAPPWIIIGSVAVLLPIFIFWTLHNIKRQKETITLLLLEKGAALIRSFEAGTRTGMMGMMGMQGGRFQLQRLLMETAQQPDISYIIVTDLDGEIKAHNKTEQIGKSYGRDIDLGKLYRSGELRWRRVSNQEKSDTFEVFRRFLPVHPPPRAATAGRTMPFLKPKMEQIIFVGLDMSRIEASRKEEAEHTVIMAVILLLIGFGGLSSLYLVQAYRSTRSSLARLKAFSDNVVENMPIGLLALDKDRNIASINQTGASILQVSHVDIMGKNTTFILPRLFTDILNELNISGRTVDLETNYSHKDGKTTPLEISASRLEDENGTFMGHIILFRDLTEVNLLKKEIERNRRLASIGRLAAGIAHEIRNPLSSIKGFATYFRERYGDVPEDTKTADIMIQEVERLNRVISQLLEFSRPVNIQKKPVAVDSLIQHSIRMIEKEALKNNIIINKDIEPGIGNASIDMDSISQVLLNLYLNAIEAMEQGGNLTVSAHKNNELKLITINIKDDGKGIEKKDLVHIFDPYFTTKQSGTGLGLAIVLKIIESHNGKIKIESEPGKGTTVVIELPTE